jgi:hypothetical protein
MSSRTHVIVAFLSCQVLLACAHSSPEAERENDRQRVKEELSGEMSLKADRDRLQELRKEIPLERQKSNDELALYLQLMKQGKETPETVRQRFTSLVQKRRASYRDKVSKLRDDYYHSEVKRRNEFLADQKARRESYLRSKRPSEETREFFSQQDRERQSFFSEERTRRQSFEAELNAQSKDFESYMREKNNEFNEQYRLYAKQFADAAREKAEKEKAKNNPIDQVPAKTLSTE